MSSIIRKNNYMLSMRERYPNRTVLMYHTSSADAPPGYGCREHLNAKHELDGLDAIKNWRRILSDNWVNMGRGGVIPMVVDGKLFASVTHYTAWRRYRDTAPKFAKRFLLMGCYGTDPVEAKTKSSTRSELGLPKWFKHRTHIRNPAILVKFRDIPLPRRVLEETWNAVLTVPINMRHEMYRTEWILHIIRERLFMDEDNLLDLDYRYDPRDDK